MALDTSLSARPKFCLYESKCIEQNRKFALFLYNPCLSLIKLEKYNFGKWSQMMNNVFILYFMRKTVLHYFSMFLHV
jgi:hypothetical protein